MVPNRLLKHARELKGWSQAKVAGELGTDATTVSRWERGLFAPTPYFRERLCVLFGKNTEELGLLETVDQSSGCEAVARPGGSGRLDPDERSLEEKELDRSMALLPPSWDESTDTFAYILRSAAHDQRAHRLWKAAYVRALQGRNAEARQLGEASLRAFEYLGHVNALAVREWLNQLALVSAPAFSAGLPAPQLSAPPEEAEPVPGERRRVRSLSLALIVMSSFWLLFPLHMP